MQCWSSLLALVLLSAVAASAQDGYVFTTIAGTTASGTADGTGTGARFNTPVGVTAGAAGDLYIADCANRTIRHIVFGSGAATVSTVAGNSTSTDTARDGTGTSAIFGLYRQGPNGLTLAPNGNVYICDGDTSIRALALPNVVTTVAGATQTAGGTSFTIVNGVPVQKTTPGPTVTDGTGTSARFNSPYGITVDAQGTFYIADSNANRVRKMADNFSVSTLAGNAVFGSDDGTGASAKFFGPAGIAVDSAGNVFVADSNNGTIRKVTKDGVVTTFAGKAGVSGSGDGKGSEARFGLSAEVTGPSFITYSLATSLSSSAQPGLYGPTGLAIDRAGNLVVADTVNHTLRRISPGGVVTTMGGIAGKSGSADGLATKAQFSSPQGLAFDSAGNLYVADTGNNLIRKGTPVYKPQIQTQPQSQAVSVGQNATLSVSPATNALPPTFQWTKNGTAIAGATGSSLTLTNVQTGDFASYAVSLTNDFGTVTSAAAVLSAGAAPSISSPPVAQAVASGQSLTFSVTATGAPAPTFQWRKDGTAIPGATNATYIVASAQAGDAGNYDVIVSNSLASVTSAAVLATVNATRIVNLSIRSGLTSAAPTLTVGYVVSGSGKQLLVRAVGPGLAQFGVGGTLVNPKLALFKGNAALANNDDWGTATNASEVASAAAGVGAFPLQAGSADAALLTSFDDGGYSAQVAGAGSASGIVLVELYDTNASAAARLVNVSTRAQVGTGDNILVAGFTISGTGKKSLLIRAVGPTLATFGVSGALADPKLEIYRSGSAAAVATNDNWGGTTTLSSAFTAQGAFPLASGDSKDAALVVTLDPGSYTAQVSGVGNTTGEALIEIYEMP